MVCTLAPQTDGPELPSTFAADIAAQLERAGEAVGRRLWRPAYLTESLLTLHGFRVEDANLGRDCSSVIDFDRQIVFVGPPYRKDHKFWKLARCFAAIRIKQLAPGLDAAEATRWTDYYARQLVLPSAQVHHYIAGYQPDRVSSDLIRSVAMEFTVPIYVVSARVRVLKERAA